MSKPKIQILKDFNVIGILSELRPFTIQPPISRYLNNTLNNKFNKGSRDRALHLPFIVTVNRHSFPAPTDG